MLPKEGPGPLGSTGFGENPIPGGSSTIVGPGGQAPPFAPGGPENPYPPSAGMPPPNISLPPGSAAMQPGFLGSGAPGSSVGVPPTPAPTPYPPAGSSTYGGSPSYTSPAPPEHPRLQPGQIPGQTGPGMSPGSYPMPTKQPSGGSKSMQPQMQQSSQRGGRSGEGFMARIIPLEGGGAVHPEPPPVGPVEPGKPIPPDLGGSVTQGKPRGIRPLPMPKDKEPPEGPPKPPGQWVTIDAGKGQPPAYGFIPKEEVDPGEDSGLEAAPKKPHSGTGGHGATGMQSGSGASRSGEKSGSEHEQKGHYIPVQVPGKQPRYGDTDDEPIWCWIPQIDEHYGVKHQEDGDKDKDKEAKPPALKT